MKVTSKQALCKVSEGSNKQEAKLCLQPAACWLLAAYSSNLKMDAVRSSETLALNYQVRGRHIFIVTAVRTSNPTWTYIITYEYIFF
jgi:hypothetical protein